MTNFVDDISEIPKSNEYAYHSTVSSNLDSILDNGLNTNYKDPKYEEVNNLLERVAELEDIQLKPSDRSECIFMFPRYSEITGSEHECVLAVNTKNIRSPIYRGSFNTITMIYDILSQKRAKAEDIIDTREIDAKSKEAYELSKKYWVSLNRESPPINKGGEILIESDIPKSSITHIFENKF